MRYLITLFLLATSFTLALGQTPRLDSLFTVLAQEKNEDRQLDLILKHIYKGIDVPDETMRLAQRLIDVGKQTNTLAPQASGLCKLGSQYRFLGNPVRALQQHQQAMAVARQLGNPTLLSIVLRQAAHVYKDREENRRAISLYKEALVYAVKGTDDSLGVSQLLNLGGVYLTLGKLDSALSYSQRAYEGAIATNVLGDIDYIYLFLGGVHSRLGNEALATNYLRLGINRSFIDESERDQCALYNGLAQHYQRFNKPDSSIYYAKRAIDVVRKTPWFHNSAKPAHLLAELYQGRNCDSSLAYARIAAVAGDSLTNKQASQQIQLMTFDEDMRQMEVEKAHQEAELQRKQNIQYALIALGIFALLTLYLILSRSFITNIKTIEYAGVIGLLIVFEFLNLLLHPFLERITHHSPILMLLALVCIAALLVPLHHRLEQWAVATLVAKNKTVRLAAAKQTIAELEG